MNDKEKSTHSIYYYIAVGVVLFCIGCFLFCGSTNVYYNGDATQRTGSAITESVESNRELQDGLSAASETAQGLTGSIDRSEAAVGAANGTIESLNDNLETAGNSIKECQQIIGRIKRQNEAGEEKP